MVQPFWAKFYKLYLKILFLKSNLTKRTMTTLKAPQYKSKMALPYTFNPSVSLFWLAKPGLSKKRPW